jgi:hypothetical protein
MQTFLVTTYKKVKSLRNFSNSCCIKGDNYNNASALFRAGGMATYIVYPKGYRMIISDFAAQGKGVA